MKRYLLIFLLTAFMIPAYADEKVTVAVLDLTGKDVPNIAAKAASDIIRSEFVNIANFMVVERSQMNAILEEQGLQMSGCTDASCAVQFGKVLSARRIVIGEISKVGNTIVITARYVNVENGESLFSASGKAQTLDDIVDKAAKDVARELASKIVSGDKEVITPKTVKGYYQRSIIPGWGQFYAENPVKGWIFSGAFAVSGIMAILAGVNYFNAKSDYDNISVNTSPDDCEKKENAYKDAASYMNISIGIVSAVYIIHWVDALFFTKTDFNKLIAKNEYDTGFIAINFNTGAGYIKEQRMMLGFNMKF